MNAPVKFSPGRAASLRSRAHGAEDPSLEQARDSDPAASPVAVLDTRSQDLAAIPNTDDVVVDVDIERALEGSPTLQDASRVAFIRKFIRNTHAHWHDAARTYLKIGAELLAASDHLGRDYDRVVDGRLLPFSKAIESQLRAVARAVRDNRLPAEGLPGYSVAYKLTLLPDPLLARAKEEGLVRPNVTRREVDEYRAKLLRLNESADEPGPDTLTLIRRRDDLLRRRARLQGEIDTIAAHLGDIEQKLRERNVRIEP